MATFFCKTFTGVSLDGYFSISAFVFNTISFVFFDKLLNNRCVKTHGLRECFPTWGVGNFQGANIVNNI